MRLPVVPPHNLVPKMPRKPDPKFVAVGRLDELPMNGTRAVVAEGQAIVLIRTPDKVFALRNACSHKGSALNGGWVEDGKIHCPLHGWAYALASGKCLSNKAKPVAVFPTRIVNDIIEVELELLMSRKS